MNEGRQEIKENRYRMIHGRKDEGEGNRKGL